MTCLALARCHRVAPSDLRRGQSSGRLPGSQGPGHGIGTGRPAEPPPLLHPARPAAVPDETLHVGVHIPTDLAPAL